MAATWRLLPVSWHGCPVLVNPTTGEVVAEDVSTGKPVEVPEEFAEFCRRRFGTRDAS